jgi:predicted nucleic acid-binding protein
VEISGTLGLLKLAVEEGTLSIGEADEVLNRMIDGGYYSPIRSIDELLGGGDGK